MDYFDPIDDLVSDIKGTANLIGKILFNRNSVLAAAAISFLLVVLSFVI
jgi:hypothetical protein